MAFGNFENDFRWMGKIIFLQSAVNCLLVEKDINMDSIHQYLKGCRASNPQEETALKYALKEYEQTQKSFQAEPGNLQGLPLFAAWSKSL